jgi:ribosomal protein S18 acetylase RimI-like enzyme
MDLSVRSRLDQHMLAAQTELYRTISGGLFEITKNWARGYSGLRWPHFNVFLPLMPAALTDDNLADAAAFFVDKRVYYSVELVHDRFPEGPDFLDKRGYQALPPQPAMVLDEFPTGVQFHLEVSVEPVKTVPALTAFCTILHQVFDFPLEDMIKLAPVSHLKNPMIQHYLAFLDEQPVGAGTVVYAEGGSSIWYLSTIDAFRKRGVATTLLHRMLNDTQEKRRCQFTMLYSAAQTYHLFNKFGFEIYTQRQWFLPPGIVYDDE